MAAIEFPLKGSSGSESMTIGHAKSWHQRLSSPRTQAAHNPPHPMRPPLYPQRFSRFRPSFIRVYLRNSRASFQGAGRGGTFFGAIAFGFFALVPLCAQDLRYPPKPADVEALYSMGWEKARDRLSGALAEAYQPGVSGKPGSAGMPAYRQWLALWKWADLLSKNEADAAADFLGRHLFGQEGSDRPILFPPGHALEPGLSALPHAELRERVLHIPSREKSLGVLLGPGVPLPEDAPLANRVDPQFAKEWFSDPAFSELFFGAVAPSDYLPGVLAILNDLRKANPGAFRPYASLAIALSVVRDARWPSFWPHPQVESGLVPLEETTAADLFARWISANSAPGLLNDLRALPPSDLKFVIDAPLSESEFAWARKNVRGSESTFGKTFSSIRYATPRIKAKEFVWAGGPYTLEAIQKVGGICVDQAYFATVAGKARGLPTIFFSGQGADGGHAWFGYRKGTGRWDLDCGRYENQNYATGEALDPQSWRPISDHDLKSLAEGFRNSPQFAASSDDLALARAFEASGNLGAAGKAYDSAVAVCPQNPDAWDEKGAFLARSGVAPDVRRSFHEAAYKQFLARRDIRVRHQKALADIARETGDTATADKISRQIISQNSRARSDLSVSAAAEKLTATAESGNAAAAMTEYRSMLRQLGRDGGGNFFYEIVRPFFEALVAMDEKKKAAEVLELARKTLHPTKGQILDQELETLEKEIE